MDKNLATVLMREYEKREDIIQPDLDLFVELLQSVNTKGLINYYRNIPFMMQYVMEESGEEIKLHRLSLRRLIDNRKVAAAAIKLRGKYAQGMYDPRSGNYSSTKRLEGLLYVWGVIVKMMHNSTEPYSILAKQKTYEVDNEGIPRSKAIPVMITPGADYRVYIPAWELLNSENLKRQDLVWEKEVEEFRKKASKNKLYPLDLKTKAIKLKNRAMAKLSRLHPIGNASQIQRSD